MEQLLRLSPAWARQARTALRQVEQEELGMDTFITSFEEIGRAEGRVEGRAEERRNLVLRQLERKVGPLASDVAQQISALAPDQLLALSDALLDFTSSADLMDWLATQPGDSPAAGQVHG
jgi:hypothetical protein